jgi:transcription elongation GreA/GreB family factor
MQKMLMRRKDELETQLTRARGTDFANARTDVVSIGTVVQAVDLGANQTETFTILGAWDSDPDKGVISYLSPVAQSLLNNKVGDEVEFEFQGAKHRHRIERIEAFKLPGAGGPATPSMQAQVQG